MKHALLALTEAVRLARLEIACYRDEKCRATAEWTINRLDALLSNKDVDQAIAMIAPEDDSPSIVPSESERQPASSKH